ncbi:MAG: YcxB family protein [Actinoplanes sp.]
MQITARPTPRLMAAAIRRSLHRHLMLARLAGWAAIGLALLLDVFTPAGLSPSLLMIGVLLAVGVPMLLVNNGTRRALRDAHLTTYEISDGGVASSNLDSRQAYAWSSFTYVEEMSGQLIFGRNEAWFLPVPTGDLSPVEVEQVLGTAEHHGLRVRRA